MGVGKLDGEVVTRITDLKSANFSEGCDKSIKKVNIEL